MRLVSQDGMFDVPYEQVAIELKESEVWCEYSATVQSYCTGRMMAKYTTKAKALKVMEMLREKYAKIELFKSVYQKGLLTELNKELGFGKMQNTLTSIFQFPKDEELEV